MRWLDAYVSKNIRPGSLGFHCWSPILGTVETTSVFKSQWVRIRGLPLHVWIMERFKELSEAYGGFDDVDPILLNLAELRWVMKLKACEPAKIL